MDAFFAAIEALDDSSLKGKPVIVGGLSRRGVVSTASYEARRFGIHSAMPVFKAREKCPHGIFLPVKMERYKEVSRKIMGLLKDFSPLVEQVSIDEAYLDITGTENLFGCPEDIARRIKERVGKETGLTCSIGIAPNKFMAKVASDMNKPDGLKIISDSEVVPKREIKSISSEETLQKDTGDLSKLKDLVKEHAEKVAWRLRNEELKGKTITIKIKFSDFSAFTKSQTIAEATDSSKILRDSAMKLFLDSPIKRKVRLIGVAVSNLDVGKKQFQMSLFEDPGKTDKNRKVEEAMDEIRGKFGGKVIERGKE